MPGSRRGDAMPAQTLLKDLIDEPLVRELGARVAALQPDFDAEAFSAAVLARLHELELKQRYAYITEQLRLALPLPYPAALKILVGILDCADERFARINNAEFRLGSIPLFVERYGLEHPQESLDAIALITRHTSCEFAIRPFLLRYPQQTLARLSAWARHENEHVRRLVSEGSRPRLPWAPQLKPFIEDPVPTLALLELLKDDPSLYVRRSVANHLNDIGKDHPQLLLRRMQGWSDGAPRGRQWLIRHALRTLVKRGDARALAILGYAAADVALSALELRPNPLRFGGELSFSFQLRNRGAEQQNLMVDFVMHFRKANGRTSPKVFKLKTLFLPAGASVSVGKRIAIRQISTRRYYPGRQRLEIQVNGQIVGGADFELVMD